MTRSRVAVVAAVAAALAGSVAVGWLLGAPDPARPAATVVAVVDGDTVVVALGDGRREQVRVLGVDTPETVHPRRPVECGGPEASAHTSARVLGRRVTLEIDTEPRDVYDRLLAHVWVDGANLSEELLRHGLARLLILPPNDLHSRALLAAEVEARRAGRGGWTACGWD